MTQRDKKMLLIIVLSLAGVAIAVGAGYSWFYSPLMDYNKKIAELRGEVESKEAEIGQVIRDRKLLNDARGRSLPLDQVKAAEKYTAYLNSTLNQSLTNITLDAPTLQGESKAGAAALSTQKKPGHTTLTWGVHAKGNLKNVVAALESLERTPVLHRVKTLSLSHETAKGKDKEGLVVTMTVEALIVAGAKKDLEPELTIDEEKKLPSASNTRDYTELTKKDIFLGPQPLPTIRKGGPVGPIDPIIKEHVRLVSISDKYEVDDDGNVVGDKFKEGWLRNLILEEKEQRLRVAKGYDKFQIHSEAGSEVLVSGIVLKIEEREVHFQVADKVFTLHIGQTVGEALRRPLSEEQIAKHELTSLIRAADAGADNSPAGGGFRGFPDGGMGGFGKGKGKGGPGGQKQGKNKKMG